MHFPRKLPLTRSSWTTLAAAARSKSAILKPRYFLAVPGGPALLGIWGNDQLCTAAAIKPRSEAKTSILTVPQPKTGPPVRFDFTESTAERSNYCLNLHAMFFMLSDTKRQQMRKRKLTLETADRCVLRDRSLLKPSMVFMVFFGFSAKCSRLCWHSRDENITGFVLLQAASLWKLHVVPRWNWFPGRWRLATTSKAAVRCAIVKASSQCLPQS